MTISTPPSSSVGTPASPPSVPPSPSPVFGSGGYVVESQSAPDGITVKLSFSGPIVNTVPKSFAMLYGRAPSGFPLQ